MTDQFATVTVTIPSGSTTYDVTDVGITETWSAAFGIYQSHATDDTDVSGLIQGTCSIINSSFGQAVGVDRSMCAHGRNSALSAPDYNDWASYPDSAPTIIVADPTSTAITGTLLFEATSSAISGGFRLTISTSTADIKFRFILFAGLTGAANGFFGGAATSGTEDTPTGAGAGRFEPDVVLLHGSKLGSVSTNTSDADVSLGFCINDGSQTQAYGGVVWRDVDEPSAAVGRVGTAGCAGGSTSGSFVDLVISGFSSTGFTWTKATSAGLNTAYLALKFSSDFMVAGVAQALTSSAGSQTISGYGFGPQVAIGFSCLLTSANATLSNSTAGGAGLFISGTDSSRACTVHGEVGKTVGIPNASFNCHSRSEDVALLTYSHTGTVSQRATWSGVTADGFTLNFSTATAGYLVAFGLSFMPPPQAVNEEEDISDSTLLVPGWFLIQGEEEDITDGFVGFTNNVTGTEGPLGFTYFPGAERGTTIYGHAEEGLTL